MQRLDCHPKNSLAVPRDENSSQTPTPIELHIFSGGPFFQAAPLLLVKISIFQLTLSLKKYALPG